MNIFEIDAEIEQLLERATDPETGEIDAAHLQALYDLSDARRTKVENIALAYKNAAAAASAIREEALKLTNRGRAAQNNANRLRELLSYALDGQKLKTPLVSVWYRDTSVVEVTDAEQLTDEYLRFRDPEPDKIAIKDALQAGIDVPGARLTVSRSTIVR